MVVDDSKNQVLSLERLFKRMGHEVSIYLVHFIRGDSYEEAFRSSSTARNSRLLLGIFHRKKDKCSF